MKILLALFGLCLSIHSIHEPSSNKILESFTITTQNVTVRDYTKSSLQLRSDSNSYAIKLEPNAEGRVIFALSGIGYTSTARVSNLCFGVKITGYYEDQEVYPTFSLDDINREIVVEANTLKFQRINGAIPVWFDHQVDSVNLQFFNSMALNINQYLGLQDLRIVPSMEMIPNPGTTPCQDQNLMVGIDGSSSIDKRERALIGSQLLQLARKPGSPMDSNSVCIMEFGTEVESVVESAKKRELVHAVKKYKRDKNNKSKFTSWTNWSVAFDEAIQRKPDIFIFITDGWSNWSGRSPASFSAQYESLISKCNTLKSGGTRLLFITADMDQHRAAKSNLYQFLNGDETVELREEDLHPETRLEEVDLITLKSFSKMQDMQLGSIYRCPVALDEVAEQVAAAMRSTIAML